ncbi:MAG: DUF302 domain-containing protein [Bryobacteraceae bacterium]
MQRNKLTAITDTAATAAFVLNSGFEPALTRVRRAIRAGGLCIAAEIDVAKRLKRALRIGTSPCRVLLVDTPLFMLQAAAVNRASGVLIPLHVVVSGAENRTTVHLLNLACIRPNELSIGVRSPLLELRQELFGILSNVADGVGAQHDAGDRASLR